MSALAADRPMPSLRGPLTLSIILHMALFGGALINAYFSHRGENWGGPGSGTVTVSLVGSTPGVPLPEPAIVSPSRVVDESKGLYKSEPPPEIQAPQPDAIPLTKFKLKPPPPKYVTRKSKILENRTPPPQNAIPYGAGGTPTVPYSSFAMGAGNGTQAGLGFGQGGGGDFGSLYPWYVQAVQRRISSNWLQSTIDPNVAVAPRATITFDILRDGTIANVQIEQSSGNYSVDSSAVRAIRDSSPLNALPSGFSGSRVGVEFWFEFRRQ